MSAVEHLRSLYSSLYEEQGLAYTLRVHGDWDQEAFEELVATTSNALDELLEAAVVPRWMAGLFARALPSLISLMELDAVVRSNRNGLSDEESRRLFQERVLVLRRLTDRFCDEGP